MLTRFCRELFGSVAIRSYRQRLQYKYFSPIDFDRPLKMATVRNYSRSTTLHNVIEEKEFASEAYDASCVPLIDLLYNQDIRYALRHGIGAAYRDYPVAEVILRFCPVCAENQRRNFGVSWWSRDTNLPHVVVCPQHHAPLSTVPIEQVVCERGALPHELLVTAVPIDVRVDSVVVSRARAMALLCERSQQIDTSVFEAHIIDTMPRFRSRTELYQYLERNKCGLHSFFSKDSSRAHKWRHDGITVSVTQDTWLALFAVLAHSPEDTIAELVRLSHVLFAADANGKNRTVQKILKRCKQERDLLSKNIYSNITHHANDPVRNSITEGLAPLVVDFLLLEELAPRYFTEMPACIRWRQQIRNVTDIERSIAWQMLDAIIERGEAGTRSAAYYAAAESFHVIPEWQQTFLSALLRYGQSAVVMRYKATPRQPSLGHVPIG